MMSSVGSCSRLIQFDKVIKVINSIPHREEIASFASVFFPIIQNTALGIFGFKEIVTGRVKTPKGITDADLTDQNSRIRFHVRKILFKIKWNRFPPNDFHGTHGLLYLASGASGLLSCCAGAASKVLGNIGGGFFLSANIVDLDFNVSIYRLASSIDLKNAPESLKEAVHRLKRSAIIGMISNIGHIITPFTILFGPYLALTIFFTGIAVSTGCIKILYDYFFL